MEEQHHLYYLFTLDPDPTTWNPPSCWTGPNAALHQSFDTSDGFVLMEGMNETTLQNSTVPGKVNSANIEMFVVFFYEFVLINFVLN